MDVVYRETKWVNKVCSTVVMLRLEKSCDGVDSHDCALSDCSTSSTWLMAVTGMRLKTKGKQFQMPNRTLH